VARTVTLSSMRTWARQLSDTENDSNVADSELTALVNRHLCEVYDLLVESGSPEYYAASTTVTTSNGIIPSSLTSDFRNLVGVYVHESSEERRPLFPMPEMTRGRYKAPTGEWTVTLEYIPAPDVLSADDDTFDGISGWEALIVNLVARDVMVKREADPSVVMANIGMLQQRIQSRSRNRDRGNPKRIVDLDEAVAPGWPWGWTNSSRLACYRLRAGNIELYESLWGLP
jgi:hypothetical protein